MTVGRRQSWEEIVHLFKRSIRGNLYNPRQFVLRFCGVSQSHLLGRRESNKSPLHFWGSLILDDLLNGEISSSGLVSGTRLVNFDFSDWPHDQGKQMWIPKKEHSRALVCWNIAVHQCISYINHICITYMYNVSYLYGIAVTNLPMAIWQSNNFYYSLTNGWSYY